MSSPFTIDVRTSFALDVYATRHASDLLAFLDSQLHMCTGPHDFPDLQSYMACACEWVANGVNAWLVQTRLPKETVTSVMMLLENGQHQTVRVCLYGSPMG